MRFSHAITRTPGADCAAGLTTARELGAPEPQMLLVQHARYEELLRELGVAVTTLPPLPGCPDAYFIEDAAVVLDEVAVVTRPGAASRRDEPETLQSVLARRRVLAFIESPGTVDGGDVLVAARHAWVGLSQRTNAAGAAQLCAILRRQGYRCTPVDVTAGLHLKSSVSALADETLLVTPGLAGHRAFAGYRKLIVAPEDVFAANVLALDERIVVPAGFPRVVEQLENAGLAPLELEISEMRKMDGALTCLSLRFD